ncbi:hypothetical protein EIP91_004619 [Steccherinum ochraceum]|uniref:UspA domain-containing protein n=1 Tax=Steccherinum ochraceum TaxID=92696 RepID=A0A4R0RWB7_9APHY|nr:hypothetical protein EIP91_004619 [Steccherinum ochraceum]
MANVKPDGKRRNWIGRSRKEREDSTSSISNLPVPQEGRELSYDHPLINSVLSPVSSSSGSPSLVTSPASTPSAPSRSSSTASLSSLGGPPTRPTTPSNSNSKRGSISSLLTKDDLDLQAPRIFGSNALERTTSAQQGPATSGVSIKSPTASESRLHSGSFSKRSLTSMMGGLSSLSLSRSRDDDKERGRSEKKEKEKDKARSSSYSGMLDDDGDAASVRARSQSPFRLRNRRRRDSSPTVEALSHSDAESDAEISRIRPRNAFSLGGDDDSEAEAEAETEDDDDSDEESWSEADDVDPVTSRNTERNALIPADAVDADTTDVPDPLGEGVNVVIAPEPYFPSTLNASSGRNPRRRKSRPHDLLHLDTSRPVFQRDRCTITLTHGEPGRILEQNGRRSKRYVLASDLSEESRYALEWGIGTVLRDGDEMLIVNVVENEAKVDPLIPNPADRAAKLRSQQERQALAYILVRQATSLLQRTKLHVTIACQAWHAKNSRHMLLDIVDYVEPTMLIVGSRGLGNLKGILLGSTSHYLIQKCSVPVMVARRRLKRPPRRAAHLATHRARVSLAQAGIDRVAAKVDQDVAVMREQIAHEEDKDEHMTTSRDEDQDVDDDDVDTEVEGEPGPSSQLGRKVAG